MALTSFEGGLMSSFYSLPGRKVLGFSHGPEARVDHMRPREFIILLGGAGSDLRQAIIDEDTKRKITAILPLQAPRQRPAPTAGPEAKSFCGHYMNLNTVA